MTVGAVDGFWNIFAVVSANELQVVEQPVFLFPTGRDKSRHAESVGAELVEVYSQRHKNDPGIL